MSRFTNKKLQAAVQAALNLAKGSLMVAGLVALVAWEMKTVASAKPVTAALDAGPPVLSSVQPLKVKSDTAAQAGEADVDLAALGNPDTHKRIAQFLARKYRVSADATQLLVGAAYVTGKEIGIDPHLILAVMAVESRFNPFAESVMGAKGLMQVIPKYHMDKFEELGGSDAALNPVANIKVGAMILKDYIRRFGSVESALRVYSGATGDDFGYPNKVLAERDRLVAAGSGKLVLPPPVIAPKADKKAVPFTAVDAADVPGVPGEV